MKALFVTLFVLVHSWYPNECCSDQDCKPIPCDELAEGSDGSITHLPTRDVYKGKQIRASQDRFCHVCAMDYPAGRQTFCVFILQGA